MFATAVQHSRSGARLFMLRRIPLAASVMASVGALVIGMGCADQPTKPTSRPTESALRDPFGYKPFRDEPPSISGGGIGNYDKKAMDHDLKTVFDP
jgi:hypothetical protein